MTIQNTSLFSKYSLNFCKRKRGICGISTYYVNLRFILSDAHFCLSYEKVNYCKIWVNLI